MTRRLLAIAVLLVLAVSTAGHIKAVAATDEHDPAPTAIAAKDAVDSSRRETEVLRATPQTDCGACTHCFDSVCSLVAVPTVSAVEPELRFLRADWRIEVQRLHKTTLDPGLRPPIPVS